MVQAYKEDLAYVHDVGFGAFSSTAAPELLKILQQKGISSGLVVDLGCGSGIWAEVLSDAGYEVFGVDISSAMIEIARRRATKARFEVASFLKIELPKCRVVTSLGECVNYQFDEQANIRKLFTKVYDALERGGIFIFDVLEPGSMGNTSLEKTYSQGEDWAVLVEKKEDREKFLLTRQITTFRKIGDLYRKSEEVHKIKLYRASEIAHLLKHIGFQVKVVRGYGKMRFRKALAGFIAKKPV